MNDLRTAAQQALEALEDFRFAAGFDRPLAQDAIDALREALAQQAEPLNLRDPAVQKRLATQWGYVPAAQAEPVEPVAWECKAELVQEPPRAYYTIDEINAKFAPPQRKPLTEKEIKTAFHAARNAKLGASQDNSRHRLSVIEIARAVEKASWEKNHGQA